MGSVATVSSECSKRATFAREVSQRMPADSEHAAAWAAAAAALRRLARAAEGLRRLHVRALFWRLERSRSQAPALCTTGSSSGQDATAQWVSVVGAQLQSIVEPFLKYTQTETGCMWMLHPCFVATFADRAASFAARVVGDVSEHDALHPVEHRVTGKQLRFDENELAKRIIQSLEKNPPSAPAPTGEHDLEEIMLM